MIQKLSSSVTYIGASDMNLDLFESQYQLHEGMAYNSYVVKGDRIAIMDTVDALVGDTWKDNLLNALDGAAPDYLVVHHMEPDHSALISWVVERWPDLRIVASEKCFRIMSQFFDDYDFSDCAHIVKEGDVLDLGGVSLKFFMAPMVHWPEVMVSYCPEEGILFSADAFGKFGGLGRDVEEFEDDWASEAREYYYNICGKYGAPVSALLKKASALDIKKICPLHGPVIASPENIAYVVGLYKKWSTYTPENDGVLVAYASIHGGTAEAAEILADMLRSAGAGEVKTVDLARCNMSETVADAFYYRNLVVAAASYDAGLFPPAYEFIHHLHDKAFQGRRVALVENGSWAPTASRVMCEMFCGMKNIEIVEPVVTISSRLKEDDLESLEALVKAVL